MNSQRVVDFPTQADTEYFSVGCILADVNGTFFIRVSILLINIFTYKGFNDFPNG